jgi:hypothetical protein
VLRQSQFHLIDLAGSERQKHSKVCVRVCVCVRARVRVFAQYTSRVTPRRASSSRL